MERKSKQKLPPSSWFQPYNSTENQGASVGMSEEFRSLGNGEVGRRMNQWVGYTRIISTQTAFSPQDKTMYAETIKEAEVLITKATGFSPEEIWNRAIKIYEQNKSLRTRRSSNGTK